MLVENILKDRGKTHGNFSENAKHFAQLKGYISTQIQGKNLSPEVQLGITMICFKLSRLMHNPDNSDTWADIAGYSTLVAKFLNKGK